MFVKGLSSNEKQGFINMFINSEKYISGKINKSFFDAISRKDTGETIIRGQYYGSGTRINSCGTIYRPGVGFLDVHVKIVEYEPDGNIKVIFDRDINFKEYSIQIIKNSNEDMEHLEDTEQHKKNLYDKISNVFDGSYCPITDFTKICVEYNGINFIFRFRQLERFGNDIEISGVSFF